MSEKYNNITLEQALALLEKYDKELKRKEYGLVWDCEKEPEKVVEDCKKFLPVLKEDKSKHITTGQEQDNILIEGDNYHALQVLSYTHKGRIDVIYIDPPYNTGNKDFVYNDRFVDKEDGYRHSKWLNFMEKRLDLARDLLTEEGVIFISIDDNEQANLKLLCDKIFSEGNFVAQITREAIKGGSKSRHIREQHDYVLIYAKNINLLNFSGYEQDGILLDSEDEKGKYKKGRELNKWGAGSRREDSPSMWYPITGPNGEDVYPIRNDGSEGRWRLGKKTMFKRLADGDVIFEKRANGTYIAYEKIRDNSSKIKQFTTLFKDEYINAKGGEVLKKIFGTPMSVFDYAKPVELIYDLLIMSNISSSGIVLDFMAGSGTTGQAVLELNKEDGGSRQFILCTNNDLNGVGSKLLEANPKEDKEQFGICQRVTYPRIAKVINGYNKNGDGEFVEGLGGNLRYFKTDFIKNSSNEEQLKINLTKRCTEILALKEGIFNEVKSNDDFAILKSNTEDKHLCIYYNFINESFDKFLLELQNIKSDKVAYVFSLDDTIDDRLFSGIDNLRLEPVPAKILTQYRKIMRKHLNILL